MEPSKRERMKSENGDENQNESEQVKMNTSASAREVTKNRERVVGKRWCFCFYIKCWMWINFWMWIFTLADAVGRLRPHLFIRLTTQTNKYYQLSCIHGPATAVAKTVNLWQRSSYSPFHWQRTRIDGFFSNIVYGFCVVLCHAVSCPWHTSYNHLIPFWNEFSSAGMQI